MPKAPHVKFKIDKEADKEKIFNFLYCKPKAGHSFKEIIYKAHPSLKMLKGKNKKRAFATVSAYVDSVYRNRDERIRDTVNKMQVDWGKIEGKFLSTSNLFFNDHPWPKGKYFAYFSISPPCPRYLHNKTFAVAYSKDGRWRKIVAHEMLHFIFYDYLRTRYIPSLPNTEEGKMNEELEGKFIIPLWDLSEVFDVILLNDPKFQKYLPHQSEPYPKHVEHYLKLQKIWIKSKKDIDKFLKNLEV